MDFYTLSDKAIAAELGSRLRALRLRKNITQDALAQATALSLNSIKAMENGKAKLSTLIAALRELHALEQLEQMLPQPMISPLQLAKNQHKERQRARGSSDKNSQDGSSW